MTRERPGRKIADEFAGALPSSGVLAAERSCGGTPRFADLTCLAFFGPAET